MNGWRVSLSLQHCIMNVDDGVYHTDAVNMRQLRALRDEVRGGVAGAVALGAALTPSEPGKTTVILGVGHFQTESAVGLTAAHWLKLHGKNKDKKLILNAGASLSENTSDSVYRVGLGMEF